MKKSIKYQQFIIYMTLFVGYGFYAYNRKSVSLALPSLMANGLTKSDAGLIISSQNLAYAISKFIGGVLSDQMSARLLFSSGLLVSGLVTIVFSTCSSVWAFAILWFLNGFAQGCGWPACAKILRQWFSPASFGTWWSVLSSSANIAGGLSPFAAAFIIINFNWQASLVIAGSTSIFLGSLSLVTLINSPTDIGLPSFAVENTSQRSNKKGVNKSSAKKVTWKDLIASPFLWLVSFCYMAVFCSKTSAIDWGQLYLMEERNQSQYIASSFTSSVESGGFFGGILAGYLTDLALRRAAKAKVKSQASARMPVATLMMIGVALCLHLLYFNVTDKTHPLFITIIGFVLGACLYGPIAIFGVTATESAPTHLSGTAHAVVALAANVGAIISGLPFSIIAKYYSWSSLFLLLEVITAFTVVIMILNRNMTAQIGKLKRT